MMKWGFQIRVIGEWTCEHCGAADIDHVEQWGDDWSATCALCGWDQPAPKFIVEG